MKQLILSICILFLVSCRDYQNYRIQYFNGVRDIVEMPSGLEPGDTIRVMTKNEDVNGNYISSYTSAVIVNLINDSYRK